MNKSKISAITVSHNRVYGLDILRALAIIFVLWLHSFHFMPENVRRFCESLGLDGVGIFFVLSGFLIGGILIKVLEKGPINFKGLWNFWTRRWLRTLPAYLFTLTILVLLYLKAGGGFTLASVVKYYFFLQNFSSPQSLFFGESWSLAVEEWFYLITPVTLFFAVGVLRVKPKYSVLLVALMIMLVVPCYRYYRYLQMPPATLHEMVNNFKALVVTRMDSLMYGVIGAYISIYYRGFWVKYKNPLLVFGILLMTIQNFLGLDPTSLFVSVFSTMIFCTGVLCILPFLSELKSGRGRIYKLVTHTSIISYSLYLTNYTLIQMYIIGVIFKGKVYPRIPAAEPYIDYINYSAFWLLTIFLSNLMYKYIEVPFMGLREKQLFRKRPTPQPVQVSPPPVADATKSYSKPAK